MRLREATPRAPGVSLEVRATFASAPGTGSNISASRAARIFRRTRCSTLRRGRFSPPARGGALLARVWDGGPSLDVTIPGSWLGAHARVPRRLEGTSIDFFIDGDLVHAPAIAIAGPMRIGACDFDPNAVVLSIDWARLAPYASSGLFESRVFDAGVGVTWDVVSWNADVPAATSLALEMRTGNSAIPDGSWSPWTPIAAPGSVLGAASRYLQYRAALTSSNPFATPGLHDFSATCGAGPTHAGDQALALPRATLLHPASPNPFAATTRVAFDLARSGHVRLRSHLGRRARGAIARGCQARSRPIHGDLGRPGRSGETRLVERVLRQSGDAGRFPHAQDDAPALTELRWSAGLVGSPFSAGSALESRGRRRRRRAVRSTPPVRRRRPRRCALPT